MLLPSARKIPPSFILLLIFLGFLGWQLSQGLSYEQLLPSAPLSVKAEQKLHEEHKKPLRIAIITFVTEQKSYIHLSLKNKDHYCRRHGYDFITDFEAHTEPRAPVYWKFNMVDRLIKTEKYDWIWWLDFDTLITNTTIKVADVIEETLQNAENADQIDYILTHDCGGLNFGSFVVRAHNRSLEFIHRALELSDDEKSAEMKIFNEQDAIAQVVKEDPYAGRHIFAPQSKLNAASHEVPCFENEDGEWKPGKLVIHFAGAWARFKDNPDAVGMLMRKYEKEILWGDWKEFY